MIATSCCTKPVYEWSIDMAIAPGDSEIRQVLKVFFYDMARFGRSLHESVCRLWFSQSVKQDAVEKSLKIIKTNKLTVEALSGYQDNAETFPLHPLDGKYFQESQKFQQMFWRDRMVWRGQRETIALYILCLALPKSSKPIRKENFILSTPTFRPQSVEKHQIEVDELPTKRMRATPKCGFCREPGHTVRRCTHSGIEDFREKTKDYQRKKRDASFNRNRPIVPLHARPKGYNLIHGAAFPPVRRPINISLDPEPVSASTWLPHGQVKFDMDTLTSIMPIPLVERLKSGNMVLSENEVTSIWEKLSVKLDLLESNLRDDDIEITQVHLNYPTCPLSGLELQWPVVGDNCTHKSTQFFDLVSLIQFWTQCGQSKDHTRNWNKCKVCKSELRPTLLHRNSAVEAELIRLRKVAAKASAPVVVTLD